MILVDGGKGGGQIVRTALSLSAVTKKECIIKNIRGQRGESGLKAQHLAAVKAMQQLCHADVTGAYEGSREITFIPGNIEGGKYTVDIGTAGSTTLLLQTLLPACLREDAPVTLIAKGGTDTLWCPPSTHFQQIFLKALEKIGVKTACEINRYGFYPKGGGQISLTILPSKQILQLDFKERGKLQQTEIYAIVAEQLKERSVAERMIETYQKILPESKAKIKYVPTLSSGCSLQSVGQYENYAVGTGVLGDVKKSAEQLGRECAEATKRLQQEKGVDSFFGDQLMIYLGLAGAGEISVPEITKHMQTNAEVIEQFLPVKILLEKNKIKCVKK